MTLTIILIFVAILAGMGISVLAFGTGGKRKRIFQDIYFTAEDVDGVLTSSMRHPNQVL